MPVHRRPENRKGCRKQVVGLVVIVTFAAIAGCSANDIENRNDLSGQSMKAGQDGWWNWQPLMTLLFP